MITFEIIFLALFQICVDHYKNRASMSESQPVNTLSDKIRKKGFPPSDFDVKFICTQVRCYGRTGIIYLTLFQLLIIQGSKKQVVEAHKFVLALGSDVFRAQFFGSLKGEDEIKTDWNYRDFKFFISTFYGVVNLKGKSLQSMCGLWFKLDHICLNFTSFPIFWVEIDIAMNLHDLN